MRTAPLEGDRISNSGPTLPDFLAPAGHKFFETPRWRVQVLADCACGEFTGTLVKVHEWISAPTAEAAVEAVRAYGYTDRVRFEAELVKEEPR